MKEKLKIEEIKLEIKKKNEDKVIIVNRNIQVKLPKLVITNSLGTCDGFTQPIFNKRIDCFSL